MPRGSHIFLTHTDDASDFPEGDEIHYCLLDINKDSIPELIIGYGGWWSGGFDADVYAYFYGGGMERLAYGRDPNGEDLYYDSLNNKIYMESFPADFYGEIIDCYQCTGSRLEYKYGIEWERYDEELCEETGVYWDSWYYRQGNINNSNSITQSQYNSYRSAIKLNNYTQIIPNRTRSQIITAINNW